MFIMQHALQQLKKGKDYWRVLGSDLSVNFAMGLKRMWIGFIWLKNAFNERVVNRAANRRLRSGGVLIR
jgi:hypothetical protein